LVLSVSFSPDGTRIVSGSSDDTLKLWDAATGEELRTLKGHEEEVRSVSFSPDGTRIVSGSKDETVKLWDAASGEELRTLTGHQHWVHSVSFSPDGMRVVSGSHDNTIKIWDAATGEELRTLKGSEGPIGHMSFSPDGASLVVCRDDRDYFSVWNTLNGELVRDGWHDDAVNVAIFSGDGLQLASGSRDKSIRLWDATSGKVLRVLNGHEADVTSLAFFSDDVRLASTSRDATIRVWNSQTAESLAVLKGHAAEVLSVTVSPDDTTLLSAGLDKTIRVWDVASGIERRRIPMSQEQVVQVLFSPDGSKFASVGSGHSIIVWELANGQQVQSFSGLQEEVLSVVFSQDGKRLTAFDVKGDQLAWDIESGRLLQSSEQTRTKWSSSLNPSVDGMIALPNGRDVTLKDINHQSNTEQELVFRKHFAAPKPKWHKAQAEAFEAAANWHAACFHRAWLLKIAPSDAWRYDDLHRAYDRLLAAAPGQSVVLPLMVRDMLSVPRGMEFPQVTEITAEERNNAVWEIVKSPVTDRSQLDEYDLNQIKDICQKLGKGYYFNTLGVLQYRLGRFEEAVVSLNKSIELSSAETGKMEPSASDLGFLALCQFRLGNIDKARELRAGFQKAAAAPDVVLNTETQQLIREVQAAFEPGLQFAEVADIKAFNLEASFENLSRHRWQFWPDERYVDSFRLVSELAHTGTTCLQAVGENGPVMIYQSVKVEPNTKYRLTGWIRFELPPQEQVVADSSPKENNATNPGQANTDATDRGSFADPSSISAAGASIGLLNRPESGEVVFANSDWKKVTLEFTTNESETTISPSFRFGLKGQQIAGTAWFDDLILEKVE